MAGAMQAHGFSAAGASAGAMARMYDMMVTQARTLAYVDTVHVLVVLVACLIPVGYLMKKPRFRPKHIEVE